MKANTEYHKIQSLYKRDQKGRFIWGEFSIPEFKYLQDSQWIGTEKIDGTNIRIYKDGSIGGRSDSAQIPSFILPVLTQIKDVLALSDLPSDTILYGEGYGAKIQSGGHYIPGNDFVLFDVNISGNYQPRENVEAIATKLNIQVVPKVFKGSIREAVDWMRCDRHKESVLCPGGRCEGLVLRPETELLSRDSKRIITKLKFKDF